MNTILVTGGLGYIGSHTVVELQNEGFDVVIIDDEEQLLVNVNLPNVEEEEPEEDLEEGDGEPEVINEIFSCWLP